MSKSPVSSQLLLEGGWYALEQCGRLLDDAAYLFDSGRHGSAAGLALLAREELGKARLLFKLSSGVEGGARLTRTQVRKRIEDHLTKQTAGALSVTISIPPTGALADLHKRGTADSEGAETDDAREARRDFSARMNELRKKLAAKRPVKRERALYVDLDETGTRWTRPAEFPRDEALQEIMSADNEYGVLRLLIEGNSQRVYQDLRRRLAAWPDRPELPNPARPTP